MRDPKRIRKVLKIVGDIWETCPDMRLGQLISNVIKDDGDAFYIEDPELLKRLHQLYIKGENPLE